MKIFNRIRGPRLGTKLLLWGLVLTIVPWISDRQLLGMERLLIQGQSQAQLLTAEGISTLVNGRDDLFNDLPVDIQDYESLYARPLQSPVRIDGKVSDWGEITDRFLKFGTGVANRVEDGGFELLLGERAGQLYGFMQVRDDLRVYRNPAYLRLDTSDHVRLNFIREDGQDHAGALAGPLRPRGRDGLADQLRGRRRSARLARLAERTTGSIAFTFAPRSPALAAMHAVGKLFPRGDRAPGIVPVAEANLRRLITADALLGQWRVGRTQRIASGFYTSQALELVRA